MLNSYTLSNQILTENELLSFSNNRILTGCAATHTEGTTFYLRKPGYYYVSFNAVATSATAGDISIQLLNNSAVVPGALATMTVAADGSANLSFATLIRVLPSCCAIENTASLTLKNVGVEATYTTAAINIIKIN